MKNFFYSKLAKLIVDILLIIGLMVAGIYSHQQGNPNNHWTSPHCITGLIWFLLILFHALQHIKLIKAFTRKKVIRKNKITALTIIVSILMSISILSLIFEINFRIFMFHAIVGRLFALIIIIHTINKFKRFIALFRK